MQRKHVIFILRNTEDQRSCVRHCAEQLGQEARQILLLPIFVSSTDFEKVATKGLLRQPCPPDQVLSWLSQGRDDEGEAQNIDFHQGQKAPPETTLNLDTRLCDLLHQTADSLLYTGDCVHVVMVLDSHDIDSNDSFVLLAGALRRLQVWHNAVVSVVAAPGPGLSQLAQKLVLFSDATVVETVEDVDFSFSAWSGPVLLKDKNKDKSFLAPGFHLECDNWEVLLQQKTRPLIPIQQKSLGKERKQRNTGRKSKAPMAVPWSPEPQAVCGRSVEILQPLDLSSLPTMLLDSQTLTFKLQKTPLNVAVMSCGNPKSSVPRDQIGTLARLRVYPERSQIPTCGQLDWLNTRAWKDRLIHSIHDLQDFKEKEVVREAHFLYFVILPLPFEDLSTEGLWCTQAKVLLSPHEINRALVKVLKKQIIMSKKEFPEMLGDPDDETLGSLPVVELDDLRTIQKNPDPCEAEILVQSLREKCETLKEFATKMFPSEDNHPSTSTDAGGETPLSLPSVPEYQVLQSWETLKRKFQSYPSLDNIPVPSPAPTKPKYSQHGFHYEDILRLLKPDGSLDQALPHGAKKLEGSKLCRVDSQSDVSVPWPDSQYLNYHDVYYYRDENDLRLERRYAKIWDLGFFDETRSSFVSPVKKKTGHRPLVNLSPVRRSPRKRPASALVSRRKSESFHHSASRKPSPNEATFKQPCARPLTKSPRKRPSLTLNPSPSTPPVQPLHRRLSFNLPSDTDISPIVRRSPRKHSSTPTTLSSQDTRLSETRQSALHPEHREREKQSLSQSRTSQESLSAGRRQLVPRKRLLSPSDYGSHSDTSMSGGSFSEQPSRSSTPDPERTKSPKKQQRVEKRAALVTADAPRERKAKEQSQGSTSHLEMTGPNLSQPTTEKKPGQMKRSDRHKLKLQAIIVQALEEKGVTKSDPLHSACVKNLFNVSMVLLKTLPNSQNLKEEMKNVVFGQVQQIINLEKRRSGLSL